VRSRHTRQWLLVVGGQPTVVSKIDGRLRNGDGGAATENTKRQGECGRPDAGAFHWAFNAR